MMTTWLNAIPKLAQYGTPAVLVTVMQVQGSVPREPGAKMLVTADTQYDTIGGGHLELEATHFARTILADKDSAPLLRRFALGPSLGQCCGGVVQLAFERVDEAMYPFLQQLHAEHAAGRSVWRLRPLASEQGMLLLAPSGEVLAGTSAPPAFDANADCHLLQDETERTWLCDPVRPPRAHLYLFGAGHVGTALVRALADLPCRVSWVDEREQAFPSEIPDNVRLECTDLPDAVVDEAEPGATYLVMTHSHALDQQLAEAILKRGDAGWFGLIGSQTKRAKFEHRLRERGLNDAQLARMVCPIGLPGISGKQPAVIAASVCAQLLQVWEASQHD